MALQNCREPARREIMNSCMIDPLCQASQRVCASTDLQGSKSASINAGIIAHRRSFQLRFGGSSQVAPGPWAAASAAGLRVKVPTVAVSTAHPTVAPKNRPIIGGSTQPECAGLQRVGRTADSKGAAIQHLGLDHGGSDVRPTFESVGGKGMAKAV